jgi:phenylalanyl-tRNA synthetase alpha chain
MTTGTTEDLGAVVARSLDAVAAAASLDELASLETELLGKRSALATRKAGLGALPANARRDAGRALNEARERLTTALAERRAELAADARRTRLAGERLDLTEVVPTHVPGHRHLVTQTIERLEDVFVGMGYSVAEGPEAETDWYNFEALNMPPSHPARSMWDTFYLEIGPPESTVLRTHTSPVQIRVMENQPPPVWSVMPGRCYRKETQDASHLATFHQIEGLVVDRGITLGHLAGTIDTFTEAYFGAGMSSRLRPSYFPFTEPSAEFDVTCVVCKGTGCRTCGQTGWVELGGCGMVHPNVLRNVGYDPEEWTGFAFGFGIDRLAAARHGIADLRELQSTDIRFLEQF